MVVTDFREHDVLLQLLFLVVFELCDSEGSPIEIMRENLTGSSNTRFFLWIKADHTQIHVTRKKSFILE